MAQQDGGSGPPSGEGEPEREELERLRAEVAELRRGQQANQGPAGGRWRAPLAAVLIVIGAILAPVAVVSFWAANQMSNTDRYVANMSPLISEPPIQNALTGKITTAVTSNLDVQAYVTTAAGELRDRGLPRLAGVLNNFSGSIAAATDSAIRSAVARVVKSPAIVKVWDSANRAAHTAMVAVLSGQGSRGVIQASNGKVTISLGPFITQVRQRLIADGLRFASLIPSGLNPTFTLFTTSNLGKAQAGYRLLLTLKWVLPLLSLGLLAAGVLTARRHRRALAWAAAGLAISMIVLAIGLAIGRAIYLSSVPSSVLPSDAAAAMWDTLVRYIKDGLRVLLVIGLVIAVGAFLAGDSRAAVSVRRGAKNGIAWLRDRDYGVHDSAVGRWTGAHKTPLRIASVVLVLLIFVFWGTPSVALVIWLAVILLLLLAIIELLGGRATPAATS